MWAADTPNKAHRTHCTQITRCFISRTGLHPFPFHLLSVVLHALVSMLTLTLAQHLFAKLEQATYTKVLSSTPKTAASANSSSSTVQPVANDTRHSRPKRCSRPFLSSWVSWVQQHGLWLVPTTNRGKFQALAAGLLFALHPIHTEVRACNHDDSWHC